MALEKVWLRKAMKTPHFDYGNNENRGAQKCFGAMEEEEREEIFILRLEFFKFLYSFGHDFFFISKNKYKNVIK